MTGSPGWLGDFERNFRAAGHRDREHTFALSCFAGSHFEQPPNWDVDRRGIEGQITELCREYIESGRWEEKLRSGSDFDENLLETRFYPGDMANRFLAWHLEEELPFKCEPEPRTSNDPRFDVRISEGGRTVCVVELKRLVRGAQLQSYTRSFKDKYRKLDMTCRSLLLNIFPLGDLSSSWRAHDLVGGYGQFAAEVHHPFYEEGKRQIACFPAQPDPDDDDLLPLDSVTRLLRRDLGLSR